MEPASISRVAQRLPNLLTLFFSITLVTGFRELATRFKWTVDPTFDIRNWPDVLVLLGFATTMYFVVSIWLAYNVLIERIPYTLDFGRFYFDVLRFALMFAVVMWSFLAGFPEQLQHYIWGLGGFHLLMAAWYGYQRSRAQGDVQRERTRDLGIHGTVAAIYLVLGTAYYFLVARNWATDQPTWLYVGSALLTFVIVIVWTSRRLSDLRSRLMEEAKQPVAAA